MSVPEELKVFTVAELAAMWKTGEDWIRKGVQGRKWPHTRIAREIKFTAEQARVVLASLEVPAAKATPTRAEVTDIRSRRSA